MNMTGNSTETDNFWRVSLTGRVIITVIWGSIILVGGIGNVLLLYLLVMVKTLHSTLNLCVGCLAVVDLMVLVFEPILSFCNLYRTFYSPLGLNLCLFLAPIDRGSMACCYMIFLLMGIERYTLLCYPLKSLGWWTYKKVGVLLVIIFVLTAGLCIAYGYGVGYEEKEENNITVIDCYINVNIPWVSRYETAVNVIFIFLPVPALLVLYGKVIVALKRSGPQTDGNGIGTKAASKSRSRVVKMLAVLVIVFIVCILPFRTLVLASLYEMEMGIFMYQTSWYTLYWFTRTLTYVNHAANPVVYFVMSSPFREAFKKCFLQVN